MVGMWTGTATLVSPKPETDDENTSFYGEGNTEWILGGTWLHSEGWHDMGEGQKEHMEEFWTWDRGKKKFRTFYISDWSGYGEGWAWFTDDNNVKMSGVARDPGGDESKYSGSMTFVDNNTMKWHWNEQHRGFKMEIEGTSTRKQ